MTRNGHQRPIMLPPEGEATALIDGLDAKERLVVGSILNDGLPAQPPAAIGKLLADAPESFQNPACGAVARLIDDVLRQEHHVDLEAVMRRLLSVPNAGVDTKQLVELTTGAVPLGVAEVEAKTIWQGYQHRRLFTAMTDGRDALTAHPEFIATIARTVQETAARIGADLPRQGSTLPAVVRASDLVSEPMAVPPELVRSVLHQGCKLVLGGGSKSFKTWCLMDLAVSVASGEPWLSMSTKKGRVLYLDLELPKWSFRERLKSITREKGVDLAKVDLDVWPLRGHACDYQQMLPEIIQRAQADGYALMILDPVYKLLGGADENSARDIAGLMNAVERVAVQTGAAVAFGSHFAKGNASGKESIDRISGSGVFARDPDSILTLTRHEVEGAFVLEMTLRNHPPVERFVVRWQPPLLRRDDSLDPTALKQPPKGGRKPKYSAEQLLKVLGKRRLTTAQWLEKSNRETAMAESTFYELLKRVEAEKMAVKDTKDRWQISPTPKTPKTQLLDQSEVVLR